MNDRLTDEGVAPTATKSVDRAAAVRLQLALAVAGLGTWDWDPKSNQVTWSNAHERICGFLPGTFSGKADDYFALVLPEDRPLVDAALKRAREDHVEYRCEYRIRRNNDGAIRWLIGRGAYFYDGLGRETWASGIIVDITERKQADAAARATEQRRQLLFERNPVPMMVVDPETRRYLEVNDAAVKQYGYSREEFLQMRTDDLRPAEDVARMITAFRDRAQGASERGVWRHRTKNGALLIVEIVSHDTSLDEQRVLVVSVLDVTERESALEALRHTT
jgi:PAS domain S-box-containing protein